MRRVLSQHAIKRYQQRVGGTEEDAQRALDEGDLRSRPPHSIASAPPSSAHMRIRRNATSGWVVCPGGIVFPMNRTQDGDLIATTTLKLRKRPKAERRAWRQERRDQQQQLVRG
jgi:hypothetical protein